MLNAYFNFEFHKCCVGRNSYRMCSPSCYDHLSKWVVPLMSIFYGPFQYKKYCSASKRNHSLSTMGFAILVTSIQFLLVRKIKSLLFNFQVRVIVWWLFCPQVIINWGRSSIYILSGHGDVPLLLPDFAKSGNKRGTSPWPDQLHCIHIICFCCTMWWFVW